MRIMHIGTTALVVFLESAQLFSAVFAHEMPAFYLAITSAASPVILVEFIVAVLRFYDYDLRSILVHTDMKNRPYSLEI